MDFLSHGVYSRSDTTCSSPEPSSSAYDDNSTPGDIDWTSEYGWKLYFGELGDTANRHVENLDLDYGWRLYFGELDPEPRTPNLVDPPSQRQEAVCDARRESAIAMTTLEDDTTPLAETSGADSTVPSEATQNNNCEDESEGCDNAGLSPIRLRNEEQRQQLFLRLKQEYLDDGLLEAEAETLAALQLDSISPARDLPPDVWVKILHFLSPVHVLRFSEACRSWLAVARDDAVWGHKLALRSWLARPGQPRFERFWDLAQRRVLAWGNAEHGQTGQGFTQDWDRRCGWDVMEIDGLARVGVELLSCGAAHCACVTAAGELFSWGCGAYGRLGHGSCDNVYTPLLVRAFRQMRVLAVSAGGAHTMARVQTPEKGEVVFAWGSNQYGACGAVEAYRAEQEPAGRDQECTSGYGQECPSAYGLGCYHMEPMVLPLALIDGAVKDLSCGGSHSLLLIDDGGLLALGRGGFGQLGNGALQDSIAPVVIRGFGRAWGGRCVDGVQEACAAGRAGWRRRKEGGRQREWWADVDGGVEAVAVAAGAEHSLALDSRGRVWGWGWNAHGQLGVSADDAGGDGGVVSTPCRVDVPQAKFVAGGHVHSAVIADSGRLYTFGKDALPGMAAGRLGHHSYQCLAAVRDDRMSPTSVAALSAEKVVRVSCGADHTAALCEASPAGPDASQRHSRVYVWGALMAAGEGGLSQHTRPVRVQLPASEAILSVAAGEDHALVLTTRERNAPEERVRREAWT